MVSWELGRFSDCMADNHAGMADISGIWLIFTLGGGYFGNLADIHAGMADGSGIWLIFTLGGGWFRNLADIHAGWRMF